MFIKVPLFATVLGALATASVAVPATSVFVPEVIPGPGFPSLESLGLTSEQLYSMEPPLALAERDVAPVYCGEARTAPVDGLFACYNYLTRIGGFMCTVTDVTLICEAGVAKVYGMNMSGWPSITGICWNVARVVSRVIDECQDGNGWAGGTEGADDTPGLIVYVGGTL